MFNKIATFKYIFIALLLLVMLSLKADNGVRLGDPSQIKNPKHVKDGILFTDQNSNVLYLLKDNKVEELLSFPNCGGYYVSPEKTKIGLKITDTTDWHGTPAVYDLIEKKITKLNKAAKRCSKVSFSNNGKMAYMMDKVLYVHSGSEIKEFTLDRFNDSPISPDGRFFVYTNTRQGLSIINVENGKIEDVNTGFKHNFYSSVWSPDSKKFVFYMSGTIFTYDLTKKKTYKIIKDEGYSYVSGRAYWYDSDHLISHQMKVTINEIIDSFDLYLTKYDGTKEIRLTNSPKLVEILSSVNLETKEILYHTGEQKELITTKLNNSKLLNRNVLFKADDSFRRKIFKKKV